MQLRRSGVRRMGAPIAVLLLLVAPLCAATPVLLRFDVDRPASYRLIAVNDQQIRLNGSLVRVAQIVTRAALTPTGRSAAGVEYEARFSLSESTRQPGTPVALSTEYVSRFSRDERGAMTIASAAIMPVARDLPILPATAVEPGDTWAAEAWELHDLSAGYDMPQPLVLRFPVFYRYVGQAGWDGRDVDRIDLSYTIFHQEPQRGGLYPRVVTGTSNQQLYWDREAGLVEGIEERYLIRFELSSGDTIEYSGTSLTRRVDARPLDRTDDVERLQRLLGEAGVRDTDVGVTDRGLALTLERIAFPPDSDRLLPAERERIARIAAVLERYPDNDILIVGHTALAGTVEGRRQLSLDRARVVGEELIARGVRRPEQVFYRGVGATEPVADNATEAGRERNRRVEIIILDN